MQSLKAKIRKDKGKKVRKLRKEGIIPAVLYGPKTKNLSIELHSKEFDGVYREAGESSLVELSVGDEKFLVLIHAVEIDALSQKPLHVDFYQPRLDEEITVAVPILFEGESPAVKTLGGTLVKNIHEVEVKALPQNLPHEIRVNVDKLENFGDSILVKDLDLQKEAKILKDPEEIIVLVAEPQKVEEELEKPIEEKVEEVGEAEEKKEGEEEAKEEKGEGKEKEAKEEKPKEEAKGK